MNKKLIVFAVGLSSFAALLSAPAFSEQSQAWQDFRGVSRKISAPVVQAFQWVDTGNILCLAPSKCRGKAFQLVNVNSGVARSIRNPDAKYWDAVDDVSPDGKWVLVTLNWRTFPRMAYIPKTDAEPLECSELLGRKSIVYKPASYLYNATWLPDGRNWTGQQYLPSGNSSLVEYRRSPPESFTRIITATVPSVRRRQRKGTSGIIIASGVRGVKGDATIASCNVFDKEPRWITKIVPSPLIHTNAILGLTEISISPNASHILWSCFTRVINPSAEPLNELATLGLYFGHLRRTEVGPRKFWITDISGRHPRKIGQVPAFASFGDPIWSTDSKRIEVTVNGKMFIWTVR